MPRALAILFLAAVTACAQAPADRAPIGGLGPAPAVAWEVQVNPDATFELLHDQSTIIDCGWLGWAADWKFAGVNAQLGAPQGDKLPVTGQIANLKTAIDGSIDRSGGKLAYRLGFQTAEPQAKTIGVCLEWHLKLEAEGIDGEPEVLADNRGWKWDFGGGQQVQVLFEPAAAAVYFERGNKHTLRGYFFQGDIPAGRRDIAMTVILPNGTVVKKSVAEKVGAADPTAWYEGAFRPDASPIDLSYLNHKPAGQHGFVRSKGADLVCDDGTPIRFWGGNLAAYALFVPDNEIAVHAKRIAALGYNLMRLHHHDSTRWVNPTVIDKAANDSGTFDAAALARIDSWIHHLKQEGVYVWLDLHVGREFKPGDGIAGFDEIAKRGGEGKGYCYYNDAMRDKMVAFQEAYLNHVNPLTGLAYKDDPAVMGLLITNENDLVNHFGNLMLGDKGNPYHNKLFTADVQAFCDQTGLPVAQTGQTWVHGPSKIYLNNAEARFNRVMLDSLLKLGVKVPISTTNQWAGGGFYTLPALATGSMLDIHSYGDTGALSANPRHDANFVLWAAAAQLADKPVSITEWNVPYPRADRFTAPLYLAAYGAFQGWDAPMIYNYSQDRLSNPDRAREWSTFPDPALNGLTPAAALLFRRGDVAPPKQRYHLALNRSQTYLEGLGPNNAAAVRTLAEQHGLTIGLPDIDELDWDQATPTPAGATVVIDPKQDWLPEGQTYVVSDTGELTRDWIRGIQLIDTPRTQAASGFVGGETIRLKDVTVAVDTPMATVAVSSLDGDIAASKRILLTTMARAVAPNGRLPFRTEPVTGTITVRAPAGLRMVPLAGDGTPGQPLAAGYAGGQYTIKLSGREGTHWFMIAE